MEWGPRESESIYETQQEQRDRRATAAEQRKQELLAFMSLHQKSSAELLAERAHAVRAARNAREAFEEQCEADRKPMLHSVKLPPMPPDSPRLPSLPGEPSSAAPPATGRTLRRTDEEELLGFAWPSKLGLHEYEHLSGTLSMATHAASWANRTKKGATAEAREEKAAGRGATAPTARRASGGWRAHRRPPSVSGGSGRSGPCRTQRRRPRRRASRRCRPARGA